MRHEKRRSRIAIGHKTKCHADFDWNTESNKTGKNTFLYWNERSLSFFWRKQLCTRNSQIVFVKAIVVQASDFVWAIKDGVFVAVALHVGPENGDFVFILDLTEESVLVVDVDWTTRKSHHSTNHSRNVVVLLNQSVFLVKMNKVKRCPIDAPSLDVRY